MRVLLSTYGSRGDVEPRVGRAAALRTLGAVPRVCAPPDEDVAELPAGPGVPLMPVGPSARAPTCAAPPPSLPRYVAESISGIGTAHDGPVLSAADRDSAVGTAPTLRTRTRATTLAPRTRTRATAGAATIRIDGTMVAAEPPLDENPQPARDGRRDLESELMP